MKKRKFATKVGHDCPEIMSSVRWPSGLCSNDDKGSRGKLELWLVFPLVDPYFSKIFREKWDDNADDLCSQSAADCEGQHSSDSHLNRYEDSL
jgi:hypothetical protein